MDFVKVTFHLMAEEDLLGSFVVELQKLELEKVIDSKNIFILDGKETLRSFSHSLLLSRLTKQQEVLFYDFEDDFEKLGYVRDK